MSAGSSTFYLQICKFLSGAEGIRIPDLRRAKAARCFAASFQSMQNRCKQLYFCDDAFLCISGVLLGLLHGCCNAALMLLVFGASTTISSKPRGCKAGSGCSARLAAATREVFLAQGQ